MIEVQIAGPTETLKKFCERVNVAASLTGDERITENDVWTENGYQTPPGPIQSLSEWRAVKESNGGKIKVPDRAAPALASVLPTPVVLAKSHHLALREARDKWWKAADRSKHFLAFETLRNAERFLKGPGKTKLGLYAAPLELFRIEIDSSVLTESRFAFLREAVFPTLTALELEARANVSAAREKRLVHGQPAVLTGNVLNVPKDAKAQVRAVVPHKVVMPYNYEDNGDTSEAIGTKIEIPYRRLAATWPMWKSASRSSFVEIGKVSTADESAGDWEWCYSASAPGRLKPHVMEGPFDMRKFDDRCHFSIKTGVEWVGGQYQGNIAGQRQVNNWADGAVTPGKDKLEKNSVVAMLRSYHIRAIDAKHKLPADFATQLEVLSVNALSRGDGFQVRDLSCFDRKNRQFPALSVPYAGLDIMDAATKAQYKGGDQMVRFYTSDSFANDFFRLLQEDPSLTRQQREFALYWAVGYAVMVAHVKSGLLLRYALVPVTPNPQNFIIELSDTFEPLRAIVRDVGDFLLHHEIAAAYWLEDSAWKKCAGKVPRDLNGQKFTNDLVAVEYTDKVVNNYVDAFDMDQGVLPYDTIFHVIAGQKEGNILNWGNNSTFKSWGGVPWKDLGSPLTERIMAMWGALHNEVFMKDIEEEAGIDLSVLRKKNREEMLLLPKYGQAEEERIFVALQQTLTSPEALERFRAHARQMKIH